MKPCSTAVRLVNIVWQADWQKSNVIRNTVLGIRMAISLSRALLEIFEKFQKRLLRPPAELARLAVRSLRWVSGYRTDMVDSIKLFSSYRQNMIYGRFRRFPT